MSHLFIKTNRLVWLSRLQIQRIFRLRKAWLSSVQSIGNRYFQTSASTEVQSRKLKKQHVKQQKSAAISEPLVAEGNRSLIVEMLMEEKDEDFKTDVEPEIQAFSDKLKHLEQMIYESEEVSENLVEASTETDMNEDNKVEGADDTKGESRYIEEIVLDQAAGNTMLPLDQTKKTEVKGSDQITEPLGNASCPGCGATLHCQHPAIPGYVPSEKYMETPQEELHNHFCQRCHMMRNYNEALALSVDPNIYVQIISRIRDIQALTILLVDVMDIEGSLIKNLPSLIGRKRPVFVVGNKVDLLPSDGKGYLNHVRSVLENVCKRAGLYDEMYIHYTGLISAKTGYGVEELITKLFRFWTRRGHVFLLGCTNVGKSSLFNMLLSSDYCKATSRDLIHRATTSVWPGTTLNLLKFPIMAPDGAVIQKRVKRIIAARKNKHEEEMLSEKKNKPTKLLPLHEPVGQTVLSKKDAILENHHKSVHGYIGTTYSYNPFEDKVNECKLNKDALRSEVFGEKELFDEAVYAESKWCHDTPGLVNPDQMINILNQQELSLVVPKSPLKPRNFVIKPGTVMFLSGLGRIDYNKGNNVIYYTVYACKKLPIHTVPYETADDFYREHIGTDTFKVPVGSSERFQRLPSLVACEFVIHGNGWKQSSVDIVLSSLGWVSITTGYNVTASVRAYTPGGRGCYLRSPPLLRYGVLQKGQRIGGTSGYKLPSSKPKEKKIDDYMSL